MRTIGVLLMAVALHCLGSTQAGAQLRGLGGGVPSVGGAVGGLGGGSALGGVSSGIGGSGLGGAGLGGSGLGGTDLGGSGGLPSPSITIPLQGPATPSDAVGAVNGAQGTVSSTVTRSAPLNATTNSLMPVPSPIRFRRTTNSVLAPTGTAIGQLGAAARQAQNTDPRNRSSGVPPPGERRLRAARGRVGLASDLTPRALDDLARRHRLSPIEDPADRAHRDDLSPLAHRRRPQRLRRHPRAGGRRRGADRAAQLSVHAGAIAGSRRPRAGRSRPFNTHRPSFISPRRTASPPAKRLSSQSSTPGSTRRTRKSPTPWPATTTPSRRRGRRIPTAPGWPARSSRGRR